MHTFYADVPWHAFKVSFPIVPPTVGDHFVVCHGSGDDSAHRVCMIDDQGHVTTAYSGRPSPLRSPIHLAATNTGFVLVLDADNKRIALLDPELGYVLDVVCVDHGLDDPRRICWDVASSRLYVAEATGNILVFELLP